MNTMFPLFLIALCFAWAILSMFYGFAVRPALRDKIRYDLFAQRDALRRLALDGFIAPSSFHYMYLERLLCRLIDHCSWYTFGSLIEFSVRHPGQQIPEEAKQFEETAPEEMKAIRNRAVNSVLVVMAINSPIISAFLVFASTLKRKFEARAAIYVQEPLGAVDPANGMLTA